MINDDILFGDMPPSLARQISEEDEDIKEFNEWFGNEFLIEIAPVHLENAMLAKEEWEEVWLQARYSLRKKLKQ